MRAIIVGHTGQDGRLLCERLEQRGYSVFGFSRSSVYLTGGLHGVTPAPNILDAKSIASLVQTIEPDEIYYLAAYHTSSEGTEISSPKTAFELSHQTHVAGLLYFLCAIRDHLPICKLFYASSSLVFSGACVEMQDEETPLSPRGFYAITKAQGMLLCAEFRDRFNIFASVGILYNHESHLRNDKFVSQKIIQAGFRISAGSSGKLVLGDLSARADWGYAPDFVDAFQRILQLDESQVFIVATGEAHSVREFVEIAFGHLGLDWQVHVSEDPSIPQRRPAVRIGNPSLLKKASGWQCSLTFSEMVVRLIEESRNNPGEVRP